MKRQDKDRIMREHRAKTDPTSRWAPSCLACRFSNTLGHKWACFVAKAGPVEWVEGRLACELFEKVADG